MKLTVSRSMTLNTGNYQSIRPSVSAEVEVKHGSTYEQLSDLVEKLLQVETTVLYSEQKNIDKNRLMKYTDNTIDNIKEINNDIKELTRGLI